MKRLTYKFLLIVLMSMVGLQAFADWDTSTTVQVNGLYYYLDKTNFEAQVTSMPSGKYTGNIDIPVDIIYEGKVFSVTSIGTSAFNRCTVKSVTIPNSVTSIGDRAFDDCALKSITIPNSVTSIGYAAFSGCSGLTSVTIGNGVKVIGSSAFAGCSGLTSITIGNSVTSIGAWAFVNCYGLKSVTIPDKVTSIGNYAFRYCTGLNSVTIGNSVTSIGDYAFEGCSGLTSVTLNSNTLVSKAYTTTNTTNNNMKTIFGEQVTEYIIGEGVTSIGSSAFQNCSGLTSVTIGNSVTSINAGAFSGCSGLTSVIIPNSVTSIGGLAFYGCTGLTSVTIGNSVKEIGYEAFYNCSGLTSVTIGNSVTSIGKEAFYNCSDLTSITIGNSVTSIGGSAFYNCSGLTSVTIGNSVTSIGEEAFYNCSDLTSITIPNSVTRIGKSAFYNCSGLNKVIVKDIAAWCKISFDNYIANPLYYAKHLYSDENTEITDLVIPDGVTYIGNYAFRNCSGLTSINIPNTVTTIGRNSFEGCSNITSVTLNSNAVVSKTYTADNNLKNIFGTQVRAYVIGDDVKSVGDYAFVNCSGLTSVTIPNSVKSIGQQAFSGCSGLTSIMVESENAKYDSRNNCNAIIETASNKLIAGCKNTIIPNSVTSIGDYAFYNCSDLTSITIPNSVTSIGDYAFYNCTGLTSVTIGNSVTSIGGSAFYNCSGLTSVTLNSNDIVSKAYTYSDNIKNIFGTQVKEYVIGDDVTSIGDNAFYDCSGITSFTIGNNVTSIGYMTFYGCTGLTSVTIPDKVTSIGDYAFRDCSGLESLIINGYVTSYGNSAFQCPKLTSVRVFNPTPVTIAQNVFTNRTNATLYVPNGSKSAYQAADYWKEFKEIVEAGLINIVFADANVKAICVEHWDTNGDGELCYDEAAAVTTISYYFSNNTSITSFGELAYFTGLTSIGENAFYGCSKLTSVTIPNSVKSIGERAFGSCSGLKFITIPNSVTSINAGAFSGCSGLTSVTIPNSVTYIVNSVFSGCSGLTSIAIPNSVTSIGDNAFSGCSGLTSVTIPNSVKSIGIAVFSGCSGLTSMIVESGNIRYDSRNNCNAIIETANNTLIAGCKNTIIPNSVTSIGDFAFFKCQGLTSVIIPNSVTSIGRGAFAECSGLTSVTIPNSVTSIGTSAFNGCTGLTSVTVLNPTPVAITQNVFTNQTNATLYVPKGSKEVYQAAAYWKEFNEIVEIDSYIVGDANGDGEVNVTDIVEIVNYIMEKPSDKFVFAAADVNEDGEVNVTDIVKVVSIIMSTNNARAFGMVGNNESTIYDRLQLKTNDDHTLSLNLENETGYVASQFDLVLSSGQTLETIALNNKRSNGHALTYSQTGTNTYRVVIYSLENQSYNDNNGELVNIAVSGRGSVTVENILFVTQGQEEKRFTSLSSQTTGISVIEQSEDLFNGDWYDLQGRKIVNPSRGHIPAGIYIVNGKKYVVK